MRGWAAVLAAALALGGLGASAAAQAQSCAAGETAVSFGYIADFGDVANQTLTVPAGVNAIRVHLGGAQGGSTGTSAVSGGLGGQVEGVLAVTPGDVVGALTTGYEYAGDKLHLTGYGRIDINRTRLRGYAERGLGDLDLRYGAQTLRDKGLALGLEGQYATGANWHPYWMLEYRDGSNDRSDVALNYVQRASATDYVLGLRSYGDRSFTYGGGMDLDLSAAWRLSLLLRRQHASRQDAASTFGVLLSYSPGATRTIAVSSMPTADAVGRQAPARADTGGGEDGR
ncbi:MULTISPECIES: autotransporter outer membrane beta-barrel domain-containing protein [unclassified Lysobacter]|uniref:autotransporter outer membrane beta-barrel domain-containing protein n=1 Tax=unclassified Lysobacter TaxID=2635362 RepID=UPI001BE6DEE4|nr:MULTISPECIES: autotransporter outer membrane beta-barrel domain-containing protein [unclassified Lysobacter]MBT2747518.1 autotransporter outer membrane beta-barrel domain-containing protein [Lysobacter sp. ISL-42]MBT2752341.1 autotransporter outer membrane beta-barrel domain-containing protein [Lysobacter sp. ISL-50]MBT2776240.1 autotransporter outer membrane beta-barrel domain-containing protein [Lysobacter sp. ISL-54]MBT2784091.1 autotransporter outer membrane beta-barrel domain-containing